MRRLNPLTGLHFRRNDIREDGYLFVRYLTDRRIKNDGFYSEAWRRPLKKGDGQKRINPDTGKPFKHGDYNPKTRTRFWGYDSKGSDKFGFRYEVWVTDEKFKDLESGAKKSGKKYKVKRKRQAELGDLVKRLNPETGLEFKIGDKDKHGRFFITYSRNASTNGFIGEEWGSYESLVRRQVAKAKKSAKERAKLKGVKFSVSHDYLFSIYPKDEICPIFGIKMDWFGNSSNSPSLDRIIPELGYEVGNVAWVSNRANTIKLNRTPQVLRKIADWVETQSQIGVP